VTALVILGAGGHAREVADVALACIEAGAPFELLGFVDDDPGTHGRELHEGPVLGPLALLAGRNDIEVVSGIGSPGGRARAIAAARALGLRFRSLVHPNAVVTRHVELAEGVVITAGCVLTNSIRIGAHTHVNRMTTIGHDCTVGDFVHLAPGVVLSGNVSVGDGCDIGTRACTIQGVTIGPRTIVGAGAVVIRDLPADCTAVGVPARVIETRTP
jgi:sugar O-acyltransferase (sialic acid O-acetyltransferase NeuD family)